VTAYSTLRTGFAALVTAAALAIGAGAASASTVDQTLSFNDTTSVNLTFNPFDTGLGTLTAASIVIRGTATLPAGSLTVVTEDYLSQNQSFFYVDASVFTAFDITGAIIFGPEGRCTTPLPGQTCTAQYAAASAPFTLSSSFSNLDDFIGTNPVIGLEVPTRLDLTVGQEIGGPTSFWAASGTATLTYTYEPRTDPSVIPLPAGLPLLLAGLGGLGLMARRKRKAA
jgi:hypothetical protein